jgi:hypothetical protein
VKIFTIDSRDVGHAYEASIHIAPRIAWRSMTIKFASTNDRWSSHQLCGYLSGNDSGADINKSLKLHSYK